MKPKKIAVYVGSRANYSSARPIMRAIQASNELELLVVVGAAANIARYGEVSNIIGTDGFPIHASVNTLVEGETPQTMAQSTGLGMIELSTVLGNLDPDIVLAIGDRFDVLPWVVAAAMMNIPIAHTMGGERSGTIDESIRHAITKFSNIHFPASKDAYERIIKLGEPPETVFCTGCPRIDYVSEILERDQSEFIKNYHDLFDRYGGVGPRFKIVGNQFLLVSFHPVTTEYGENAANIRLILEALRELQLPTIMLWPNADAGSGEVAKEIRRFRELYTPSWLHLFVNLPIEVYVLLMRNCAVLIGNSSSAIREGAFIGTPVVNIGSRQNIRQRSNNAVTVEADKDQILSAINFQLNNGHYESDDIYGDGGASEKICKVLSEYNLGNTQKVNSY